VFEKLKGMLIKLLK